MKRFLGLLLALLMAAPALAFTEDASAQPLSLQELNAFAASLVERALAQRLEPVRGEEGYSVSWPGCTLFLSSGDLSSDTVVSEAVILSKGEAGGPAAEAIRGVSVPDSVEALLAAYPNDNPDLAGTQQNAVLYLRGELPLPVSAGVLTREGQELRLVEHSVYYAADQGILQSGIQYTVENGAVSAVRFFGGAEAVTLEEAAERLRGLAALQEQTGYFAYDTRSPGPLTREDLSFAGLDFLDLSPQAAAAVLGPAVHEETIEDSNGELILIAQWEAAETAFIFDAEGRFLRTDRFTVSSSAVEGPRGVRVGNTLPMVLSRFEHGEGPLPEESAVLYGDAGKETAPYGLLSVEEGSALVHYAIEEGGRAVVLIFSFLEGILVEMSASRI